MTEVSLSADAYQKLRRAIIRCELAPGAQITESQVVAQFGFGRASVRAALNRLSHDGLIAVIARRGCVVAPITVGHVRELFEIRLLLEPAAVAQAATENRDLGPLRRLERACRRAKYEPGDRDAIDLFLRSNTEFHVGLVAAAGNARLADMVRTLLEEMERLFHMGLLLADRNAEMYHEHRELMQALADRDGARARAVATAQIAASESMVISALIASPGLRTINVAPAAGA